MRETVLPLLLVCVMVSILTLCKFSGRSSYCQLLLLYHLIDKSRDIMTHDLKHTKTHHRAYGFMYSWVNKQKQLERHYNALISIFMCVILFTLAVKISDA